jgi:hypothetical protein
MIFSIKNGFNLIRTDMVMMQIVKDALGLVTNVKCCEHDGKDADCERLLSFMNTGVLGDFCPKRL